MSEEKEEVVIAKDSVRDDIMNAVTEVSEKQAEPESKDDTRDEKGRFKPKAEAKVEEAPTPVVAAPEPPKVKQPWDEPPLSLKPDIKAKWAELPDYARQEWHRRESDIEKAMTSHDGDLRVGREFKEAITPYLAQIKSEGAKPIEAIQSLLNTAYQLRTAQPAQKAQLVKQIIEQYGVDMTLVPEQEFVDPRVAALQKQQQQFQQQINPDTIKNLLKEELETARVTSEVEAFGKNPANKYFEQVKPIMGALMSSGQADSLSKAYDMACMAHPEVRSAINAEEATAKAEKLKAEMTAKKKAGSSVGSSPGSPTPPNKDLTLRQELEAQFQAAGGRI